MNAKERMHYILNHREIIQGYMDLHDEEVKAKKSLSLYEKFKGLIKGK